MEIRAGKTAPCELVNANGFVIAEGTYTYCNRILAECAPRQNAQGRFASQLVGVDDDGMATFKLGFEL